MFGLAGGAFSYNIKFQLVSSAKYKKQDDINAKLGRPKRLTLETERTLRRLIMVEHERRI